MKKTIKFQTVSLGSDLSGESDRDAIKEWIRERHHKGGDILLFHLLHLISIQKTAGVDALCAGGVFYRDRIMGCLKGVRDAIITGELDIDPEPVLSDMMELLNAGYRFRMAIPAPHGFELEDMYYGDAEEVSSALLSRYRRFLREMRDAGVSGHILIYKEPVVEEFELMAGKKVFFFNPVHTGPDLELLLEYQDTIAISPGGLDLIIGMTEEYKVNNLILLDPAEETVTRALRYWDPGQISVGGYYQGQPDGYWETIVSASSYTRSLSE
ncbi:MAG TPA: hypothetical protein VMS89_02330 [Methanoregulaceae archaeon]|nr:hypothetical protein [Methanoregulaceae archaeon]